MDLKGSQKIAVLLLALGDKFTADVFKRMDRQEITAISKAIVDLPPVPREEVEAVLREFHQSLVTGMDVVSGGEDAAKRLLMANLDGETAKYVMDSLELETGPVPFRELERVSPRMLAQLLRSEHPQTLALVLGHLSASQAAGLLMRLPTEMRSLLLEHIGGLAPVDADILDEVDSVLARQAAERSVQDWRPGLQVAAEIVAAAGKDAARELLADLERHDSRLPSLLGRMVHCPEDCLKLEDGLLEEALEETSGEALVGVLDTCGPAVRTALLEHVPEARRSAIERRLREGETSPGQSATYREDFLRRVRHLQAERLQADLDAAKAAGPRTGS